MPLAYFVVFTLSEIFHYLFLGLRNIEINYSYLFLLVPINSLVFVLDVDKV